MLCGVDLSGDDYWIYTAPRWYTPARGCVRLELM